MKKKPYVAHKLGSPAPQVRSFAPIGDVDATVLILGSMPGTASLAAAQYYAHPRNAFWSIMAALYSFDPHLPYAERIAALRRARIAVWDVIATCTRRGSLDTDIAAADLEPNDFVSFFAVHPRILQVCFNGAKAESCFRRLVAANLPTTPLRYTRLPSTSPAHASLSTANKIRAWRCGLSDQVMAGDRAPLIRDD